MLILTAVVIVIALVWARISIRNVGLCEEAAATTLAPGESRTISFLSNQLCAPSGIRLEAGARYDIAISVPNDGTYRDEGVPVTTPAGFAFHAEGLSVGQRLLFLGSAPFKRIRRANWFGIVAQVNGDSGHSSYVLKDEKNEFRPRHTGSLSFFVNDAILPWDPEYFYKNNHGAANITVQRLIDPTPTS